MAVTTLSSVHGTTVSTYTTTHSACFSTHQQDPGQPYRELIPLSDLMSTFCRSHHQRDALLLLFDACYRYLVFRVASTESCLYDPNLTEQSCSIASTAQRSAQMLLLRLSVVFWNCRSWLTPRWPCVRSVTSLLSAWPPLMN